MAETDPTPSPWAPWRDPRTRLATLAVLLGVVAYVGRDRLLFTPLVRAAIARIEARSGLRIEFASLRTEGLGRLSVEGLEITDPSASPARVDGELEVLELEVDAWTLLTARSPRAVERVRARDGRLFVGAPSLAGEGGASPTALAELPVLDLAGLTLELQFTDGRAVRAEALALDTRPDLEGRRLTASAERLTVRTGAGQDWSGEHLALRGRVRADALAVQEVALEGLVRPVEAELGFDRGLALSSAAVDWPLIGGSLTLDLDLSGGTPRGELRLRCDRLAPSLARELPLLERLPGYDPRLVEPLRALDGALDATLEFVLAPTLAGAPELRCAGRVDRARLRHPVWGDGTLELAGRLALSDGRLGVEDAELALGGARLELAAATVPLTVDGAPLTALDPRALYAAAAVDGRLRLASDHPVAELLGLGRGPRLPRWELDLTATKRAGERELVAREALLEFDGGRARLDTLRWTPGAADRGRDDLDASGRIAFESLGPLATALGLGPAGAGAGALEFELELVDGIGGGELSGTLGDVELLGFELDGLQLGLGLSTTDGRRWSVVAEDLRAVRGPDLLAATGELLIDPSRPQEAELRAVDGSAELGDLRRWFEQAPPLALSATFGGAGPLVDPRLDLDLGWRPLQDAPDSGLASLREGSAVATTRGRVLTVAALEQSLGIATLRAGGELRLPEADRPWSARFERLEVVDTRPGGGERSLLALEGPLEFDAAALAGRAGERVFELAGEAGRLTVRRDAKRWRFEAVGFDSGLLPTYLLPAAVRPGAIDGTLELTEVDAARRLTGRLGTDAPRVELGAGTLVGEALTIDVALGSAGPADALEGTVRLDVVGLTSSGLWPGDATLPRGTAALELVWEEGASRVGEATLELPGRLAARAAGSFTLAPGPRLERVDLEGTASAESLAPLAGLSPDLRLTEGRLELERVRVVGPPSAPTVEARGRLLDASVRFAGDLAPLRELWGEFELTGGRLRLEGLRGEAGSAPLELTGEVGLEGERRLDLRLRGENALLHRSSDLTLRGDLDLQVTGTPLAPLVGGQVVLRNSRYDRDLALLGVGGLQPRPARRGRGFELFSLRREPLASIRFDVAIQSAEDDPLRISTNVLRGTVRPELRLIGTGAAPGLVGTVFTDPTRLRLPSTTLRIPGGLVRFEPSAPNEPLLELRGQTRLRGYDLTVTVRGPYDDPQVDISTVPPLSTEDALVLLATGELPDAALTRRGGIQVAQMLALFVAKDLGAQVFGTAGDMQETVLDRFEAEVGRDISRAGRPTIAVSFRLTDDVLVSSDSLFLTGERDRYEDVNGGLRLVVRFD